MPKKITEGSKDLKISMMVLAREDNWNDNKWIEFEITDEATGFQFLTMKMGHDDFIKCVVSNSMGYAEANIIQLDSLKLLGKKMKNKTVQVEVPDNFLNNNKVAEKLVAKIIKENKAHSIRVSDLTNYHCSVIVKDKMMQNVAVWYFDEEDK